MKKIILLAVTVVICLLILACSHINTPFHTSELSIRSDGTWAYSGSMQGTWVKRGGQRVLFIDGFDSTEITLAH